MGSKNAEWATGCRDFGNPKIRLSGMQRGGFPACARYPRINPGWPGQLREPVVVRLSADLVLGM
jgi:hypothetical protein